MAFIVLLALLLLAMLTLNAMGAERNFRRMLERRAEEAASLIGGELATRR